MPPVVQKEPHPFHLNKVKGRFKKRRRPCLDFQEGSDLIHIAGAIQLREGLGDILHSLESFTPDSFHSIVREML